MAERPTIVCLCGSTRFYEAFREANLRETLAGKIVLSIGCDFKSDDALGLTEADKKRLDELHLRKISLADEVLILNVGGYIGTSTANEISYAREAGKLLRWLEPDKVPSSYTLLGVWSNPEDGVIDLVVFESGPSISLEWSDEGIQEAMRWLQKLERNRQEVTRG